MAEPLPRRCDRCGRLTEELVEYVVEQMSRVAIVRWCADPAACRRGRTRPSPPRTA